MVVGFGSCSGIWDDALHLCNSAHGCMELDDHLMQFLENEKAFL
jgi:hypothetical protein